MSTKGITTSIVFLAFANFAIDKSGAPAKPWSVTRRLPDPVADRSSGKSRSSAALGRSIARSR